MSHDALFTYGGTAGENLGKCPYPPCGKDVEAGQTFVASPTTADVFYHFDCFMTMVKEATEAKERRRQQVRRHLNN